MIENVTSVRTPRPNPIYGVGSKSTECYPVARWKVDRRWRPVVATVYQDMRRHPWSNIVQATRPFNLFDNLQYRTDLSMKASPAVNRLRNPPSGALPVIAGRSTPSGASPWYGGVFPGGELPIPEARVYGSGETEKQYLDRIAGIQEKGEAMDVADFSRYRAPAGSSQGTSGVSTPSPMQTGTSTPGSRLGDQSPTGDAMSSGEMTPSLTRAFGGLHL